MFFRSEDEETSDQLSEYWSAASHPHLAHLPQLPHPLSCTPNAGNDSVKC